MESVANPSPYYRQDYRAPDRCLPDPVALPASDSQWIYTQPEFTRPDSFSQLSMYRQPAQNYPSPSPSVHSNSPGPRMDDFGSSSPPSAIDYDARDSQLGPVRHMRTRQLSMYKPHSRKHSISDSRSGECDDDGSDSRPPSPLEGCHPSLIPGPGLSLTIPSGMSLPPPGFPATPASLGGSPVQYPPYSDYRNTVYIEGRPPSPALSIGTSGSGNSNSMPSYHHFSNDTLQPSQIRSPLRPKKHTKKKLDALEKKKICLYHLEHQNARQEDIAEVFSIERSTVSKILKNKNMWLNVDDNAEVHSKNRPSKFPELEEVMRKWLQECIDKSAPITDSLIRSRALSVARELFISEDKFKASSGWIENFKHRHGIRQGKWTQGVKSNPTFAIPNPGVDGAAPLHPPSFRMAAPPLNEPHPSDSRTYDQPPSEQSRLTLQQEDEDEEGWNSSRLPPIHNADPRLLAPRTENPSGDYLDEDLVYLPPAPKNPTIHEAETAVETVMNFANNNPDLLSDEDRLTLHRIKTSLFKFERGMPQ